MVDNLPLLPDKKAVCADVTSVLQEVFRESDYLPRLNRHNPQTAVTDGDTVDADEWIEDFSIENNTLNKQEENLQREYAKRLAKVPLPNIYKLNSPTILQHENKSIWKKDFGLIDRKDLKPTMVQDAGGDDSLWVKNILNRSSGNLATIKVTGSKLHSQVPVCLQEENTVQSISWGEAVSRLPPPLPSPSLSTSLPDYIICIPSQLQFINFTIGQLHTHTLRLINVSKFEMRLSVRPTKHRELDVQLCSRLVVTSGAAAEIKIHFRPKDVRVLCDELLVRVSSGQILCIPILCYMEPPKLDIIIPNISLRLSSAVTNKNKVTDLLDLGARLLGDVHRTPLVLRCEEQHTSFFLLSEDAWLEYNVAINIIGNIPIFGVRADNFFLTPLQWSGGRITQGVAVCRADTPGLHTAMLRILCSTAIVRPLYLVADALLFSPKHITLQAQDKEYDICSDDDPACEYYLHLGTSFQKGSLSATVKIFNHSPLSYNYYWSVRPWGVCSCWEQSCCSQEGEENDNDLCSVGLQAKLEAKQQEYDKQVGAEASLALRVERARGQLRPRSDTELNVQVPDVGETLGLRRAVLMLILTDIPKESFPPEYDPMIVNVNVVDEEAIPGVTSRWSREICEIVCTEMEVWWEVVPVRFALDPPFLLLPHSRRIKSVAVTLRATQLYGVSSVKALWDMTTPTPAPPKLLPGLSYFTTAMIPLKELPNEFPVISSIRLTSETGDWSVSCDIRRWCPNRAPTLRPTRSWLGVLPPAAPVTTELYVFNDTLQHIYWWGTCYRWYRERRVSAACVGRTPCADCCSRTCTCLLLTPARGALRHSRQVSLHYQANAPDSDGCVATLVQVQRTAADVGRARVERGSEARATLVAYRVLAPRLVLAVLPCGGDKRGECLGCALDPSGTAILRPQFALTAGDTSCCNIRVTNITPIPTLVTWEPALEEDALKTIFFPNEFNIGGFSQVTVMVSLEARRVADRRLFVRRASVAHAYQPLYLLIDAAISAVEVIVNFPIGGEEHTDSFVSIKMMQKEVFLDKTSTKKSLSPAELFGEDDRKRAFQKANTCICRFKMVYIPPKKEPRPTPHNQNDYPRVEIVEEPPPLTRVCPCSGQCKPQLPEDRDPYCIQFVNVPLRRVRSRTVTLRSVCRLDARWRCVVRRHERLRARTMHTEEDDKWSERVGSSGLALACSPLCGTIASFGTTKFTVSVYADTWGLYYDQILIQVKDLEPLVVDVWVEAVGAALSFALRPLPNTPPVLWMSHSDRDRVVNVSNTSRADLTVYTYIVKEHEYPQEELPFRLYLRLFEVLPRVCPCLTAFDSFIEEESRGNSSCSEEMDVDVELFLAPDYGVQDETFYQVEPLQCSIKAGDTASWKVRLLPRREVAPRSSLMVRCLPVTKCRDTWYRPPPPHQRVALREAERLANLRTPSSEIRVALCALDMPLDDVMRIRKRLKLQNVGEGSLEATAVTKAPWGLDLSRNVCNLHCMEIERTQSDHLEIYLPPRSCLEMVVELSLKTKEVWPMPGETYSSRIVKTTELCFFGHEDVLLMSTPLILDLDMPVLTTEPEVIDFGFVSDGNSRKSYFTVKHSSYSAVIELLASWSGSEQFQLWPSSLCLRPGVSERVYVQFTANCLRGAVCVGAARLGPRAAGRAWCGAEVRARACVARTRASPPEDHTDDTHLLPSL